MPVTLVDRLPLPNLRVYAAGSVALLGVAVYHAVATTSDPMWRVNATLQRPDAAETGAAPAEPLDQPSAEPLARNLTEHAVDVITFMMQEPLCMWTLINMCYCCLAVCAAGIQRAVFGPLRVAEAQRVKDKLWNYVFYKFIFVFGVVNVQYMDEVLLWCSWFTIVGFLHLLAHLCKDRFEYVSVWGGGGGGTGGGGRGGGRRLVALVVALGAAGGALLAAAARIALPHDPHTFAFMAAEVSLVVIAAWHVVCRAALRGAGADAAGPAHYYTHLAFDSLSLVVEVGHVAHMVWYSRLLVSMPSLVLLLQLRHLLHELQHRLRRHRLYTALHTHMSQNYPMASREEVAKNQDKCAICWEPMKEARKLPCEHLFHNSCLCQWVQQDASCPTCRRALRATAPSAAAPSAPTAVHTAAPAAPQPDHLFRFDGSRYVSWLPSFSVEVTRVRSLGLSQMSRQVLAVFPQLSPAAVVRDLRLTGDVGRTIDNVLAGRLGPDEEDERPVVEEPDPVVPDVTPLETHDDDDDDEVVDDQTAPAVFLSSASEREAALRRRQRRLLTAARRRYLQPSTTGSSTTT